MSLSAASLIVAIPGAFLGYLLVMAFLQNPGWDNMAGFFKIISGLTLTLVTLMVLMPVGVLIFGPKAGPSQKSDEEETGEAFEEDGEEIAVADEPDEDFADDVDENFADDDVEDAFAEDDDFAGDDFADDGFEDDGFDDFDEEDELN